MKTIKLLMALLMVATLAQAQDGDGVPAYTNGPNTGTRTYGVDSSAAIKVKNYGTGGACVELTSEDDVMVINTADDTASISSSKNISLLPKRGIGNVGIGTINPIANLHVNSLLPTTGTTGRMFYITDSSGAEFFNIWRVSDGSTYTLLGNSDLANSGITIQSAPGFYPIISGMVTGFGLKSSGATGDTSRFEFADDVIVMQYESGDGNVGIGTDNPTAKLHSVGSIHVNHDSVNDFIRSEIISGPDLYTNESGEFNSGLVMKGTDVSATNIKAYAGVTYNEDLEVIEASMVVIDTTDNIGSEDYIFVQKDVIKIKTANNAGDNSTLTIDPFGVNIGTAGAVNITLPTYADEAAAIIGGLSTGQLYKTATGEVRIKL